jgi:hypothetical protein
MPVATRSLSGLLLAALLASAPSGAAVEPPYPLRTPTPLVPEETAGSGLVPEARVRIGIDARGAVERVEVLSIEPSTEHDARFLAVLVETLSQWRYAPQRRDGVPEATSLEWRVRFPARAESGQGAARPLGARPGDGDPEAKRSRVLALPEAQRIALLDAELRTAQGLLEPARARAAETPRVVARSDTESERTATAVAGNVEAIFATLARELLPGFVQQPERIKLQVVAYRSRASYAALLREMPEYEWSGGFYSPAGLIAFHLEQPSDEAATAVLLHETAHAFLDRYIVRRGVALPRWFDEGWAQYVGNSELRDGRLVPGQKARGRYELWRGRHVRIDSGAALEAAQLQRALRMGEGPGVARLLEATPETFYGAGRDLHYGSAWLFVHYLRHGAPDWATTRFPQLVLYLAEGYPGEAAVRQLYGDPDALESAFRAYAKSF